MSPAHRPKLTHDLGSPNDANVYPGGMAFSADGTRLFVVSGHEAGKAIFWVLSPNATATSLTLSPVQHDGA